LATGQSHNRHGSDEEQRQGVLWRGRTAIALGDKVIRFHG
jgi:hypothetical protein